MRHESIGTEDALDAYKRLYEHVASDLDMAIEGIKRAVEMLPGGSSAKLELLATLKTIDPD